MGRPKDNRSLWELKDSNTNIAELWNGVSQLREGKRHYKKGYKPYNRYDFIKADLAGDELKKEFKELFKTE